jgi:hypothetical protein
MFGGGRKPMMLIRIADVSLVSLLATRVALGFLP